MESTLARFFREAARDAEVAAARVRRVVIPLFALRLIAVAWQGLLAGELKHWLSMTALVVGLLLSERLLRQVRSADDVGSAPFASVGLDAAIAFAVCLVGVIWPRDSYPGLLARADWGIFPVLATAAGLRLSIPVARFGAAAAAAAAVVLVAIDLALNQPLVYGAADVLLAGVILVAAMLLGDAFAQRALGLAHAGATQAVGAERARQRLGAYVSEEVAALALLDDGSHLGGEGRDVAVLFSDLRGFTTYSESVGPEALVRELNAYLDDLVPAIRDEGGVVDKYIGDAIMAVFGAPVASGDEACRAIRAAVAMEAALERHNRSRAAAGLPPLKQGIGVHWGRVVAGNVGTRERLQYTVVGDTVNVASRLEGATKEQGVTLLISESVVERARAEGGAIPALAPHGRVPVRGRSADLATFRRADVAAPSDRA